VLKGLQLLNFTILQQIVKYKREARNKHSNSTSHECVLLSFKSKFRRGHMGWISLCFTNIQTTNNGKDHGLKPCAMWTLPQHVADAMLKFGSPILAEYYSMLLLCYLYCPYRGISAQECQKHFSAIMPNLDLLYWQNTTVSCFSAICIVFIGVSVPKNVKNTTQQLCQIWKWHSPVNPPSFTKTVAKIWLHPF